MVLNLCITKMAPLPLSCHQLSHISSPSSSRSGHNLPGKEARSVSFVRRSRYKSHSKFTVKAVSENVLEKQEGNNNGSGSGLWEQGGEAQPSPGMLAVHGGERAGRPRVSGANISQWHPLDDTVEKRLDRIGCNKLISMRCRIC